MSARGYSGEDRNAEDLLQNLGECRLVDLDKLLQLVEIIAEKAEPLVESDIVRRKFRRRRGRSLYGPLLVQQCPQAEFELVKVSCCRDSL